LPARVDPRSENNKRTLIADAPPLPTNSSFSNTAIDNYTVVEPEIIKFDFPIKPDQLISLFPRYIKTKEDLLSVYAFLGALQSSGNKEYNAQPKYPGTTLNSTNRDDSFGEFSLRRGDLVRVKSRVLNGARMYNEQEFGPFAQSLAVLLILERRSVLKDIVKGDIDTNNAQKAIREMFGFQGDGTGRPYGMNFSLREFNSNYRVIYKDFIKNNNLDDYPR
jgi:hypothetical protein